MAISFEKQLAALLVARGVVGQGQIYECNNLQRQYADAGAPVPGIGEILVERGLVDPQVIEQLQRHIRAKSSSTDNFSDIAVQKKYCTREQADYCLARQQATAVNGRPTEPIGQIFIQFGYLTPQQVEDVTSAQNRQITICAGCGISFSHPQYKPGTQLQCPRCGAPNIVLTDTSVDATPVRPPPPANAPSGGILVRRDVRRQDTQHRSPKPEPQTQPVRVQPHDDPSTVLRSRRDPGQPDDRRRMKYAPSQPGGSDDSVQQRLNYRLRRLRSADDPAASGEPHRAADAERPQPAAAVAVAELPPEPAVAAFGLDNYVKIKDLWGDGVADRWLARHSATQAVVEVVQLNEAVTYDKLFLKQWLAAAKRAVMINHPFIRKMLYAGADSQSRHFAFLEQADGQTAQEILLDIGPFPLVEAVSLLGQIAQGLRFIHDHGIFHGNIRPDKIIIGPDGRPKITDVALIVKQDQIVAMDLARNGMNDVPLWLPPELSVAEQRPDQRSDIFSLGLVFYYMIAGQPPVVGNSAGSVLMFSYEESLIPPSQLNPAVPKFIDRFIAKMTATEPAARYQSMMQLIVDIQRIRQALDRGASVGQEPAIELGQGDVGRQFDPRERARKAAALKSEAQRRGRTKRKKTGEAQPAQKKPTQAVDFLADTQDMPSVDADIYGDQFTRLKRDRRNAKSGLRGAAVGTEADAEPEGVNWGAVFLAIAVLFALIVVADLALGNRLSQTVLKHLQTQTTPAIPAVPVAPPGERRTETTQPVRLPSPRVPVPPDVVPHPTDPHMSPDRRLLDDAQKAFAEKRFDVAYSLILDVTKKYPLTESAERAQRKLPEYAREALDERLPAVRKELAECYEARAFEKARLKADDAYESYKAAWDATQTRRTLHDDIDAAETLAFNAFNEKADAVFNLPTGDDDDADALDALNALDAELNDMITGFGAKRAASLDAIRRRIADAKTAIDDRRVAREQRIAEERALRERIRDASDNLKNVRERFIAAAAVFDLKRASAELATDDNRALFDATPLETDFVQLTLAAEALDGIKRRLIDSVGRDGVLANTVIQYNAMPAAIVGADDAGIKLQIASAGFIVKEWTVIPPFDLDKMLRKIVNLSDPDEMRAVGILHFCLNNDGFARNALNDAARLGAAHLEPWATLLKTRMDSVAKTPLPDDAPAPSTLDKTPPGFKRVRLPIDAADAVKKAWTFIDYEPTVAAGTLLLTPTTADKKGSRAECALPENTVEVVVVLKIVKGNANVLIHTGDAWMTLAMTLKKVFMNVGVERRTDIELAIAIDEWRRLSILSSSGGVEFSVDDKTVRLPFPGELKNKIIIKGIGSGAIIIKEISCLVPQD
ncbi:MAG: serine/threonine-protein kinase [Planctomycetota bacterium]